MIQFRDDPEPLNLKQTTAAATLLYVVIDPIYSGFNILYIIFCYIQCIASIATVKPPKNPFSPIL